MNPISIGTLLAICSVYLVSQTPYGPTYPVYEQRTSGSCPYNGAGRVVPGTTTGNETYTTGGASYKAAISDKKKVISRLLPSDPYTYVNIYVRKDGYKVTGNATFTATPYSAGTKYIGDISLEAVQYLISSFNQDGTLNLGNINQRNVYKASFGQFAQGRPGFVQINYNHGYNTWNSWTTYNATIVPTYGTYAGELIATSKDSLYEKEHSAGVEWRNSFFTPINPTSFVVLDYGKWLSYLPAGESGVERPYWYEGVAGSPYQVTYEFGIPWSSDYQQNLTIDLPVPGGNNLVSSNTLLSNPYCTNLTITRCTKYEEVRIRVPQVVVETGDLEQFVLEQEWLQSKVASEWPSFVSTGMHIQYYGDRPFLATTVSKQ